MEDFRQRQVIEGCDRDVFRAPGSNISRALRVPMAIELLEINRADGLLARESIFRASWHLVGFRKSPSQIKLWLMWIPAASRASLFRCCAGARESPHSM